MNRKLTTALLLLVLALALSLCACNPPAPGNTYGELTIEDVTAWVGYPPVEFDAIFEKPKFEEPLTFTYDETALTIDAENMTVLPLQEGDHTVTATSEHFEAEFVVSGVAVNKSNYRYDTSRFDSTANTRAEKYASDGTDGKTTVFIGDSFFDAGSFWTNFYSTYSGLDALCLGISATTTYDWEVYATTKLAGISPKNLVMHVGTNNVYDDNDDAYTAIDALQRMFYVLHDEMPETHIYWFTISQRSYGNDKITNVNYINANMMQWAENRDWFTAIDTSTLLTTDMLKDNVHPKLEHYSIFVDALNETDIEFEEKQLPPPSTDIADIIRNTGHSVGASENIIYMNEPLTKEYVLTGTLTIDAKANNGHVEMRFGADMNNRLLLWDHNSNGKFKLCWAYENNVPDSHVYTFTTGSTITFDWKLVVTDNDIYFYVNNVLKLVRTAFNPQPVYIGSEALSAQFTDMAAVTKKNNAAEYEAEMQKIAADITAYGSQTTDRKIVVIA